MASATTKRPARRRAPPGSRRSDCPVACTLDVLGDRWSLLLIRDLFAGPRRYGDLLAAAEHIPTNILAKRLRRLEHEGIIRAERYSERPPRYEYALTPKGRELGPALDALAAWGVRHFPGSVRLIPPPTAHQADDSAPGARGSRRSVASSGTHVPSDAAAAGLGPTASISDKRRARREVDEPERR